MSEYIYFTDEQKRRANAVDLVNFLERQGEKLIKSGPEKRLSSDHSITVRGNEWFDHDEAGIKADKRIAGILAERGYRNVFPLFSVHKDWNEDIRASHGLEAIPAEEPSPVPQQSVQAMA